MKIYKRDIQHDYTYEQIVSIQKEYNLEQGGCGNTIIGEQMLTLHPIDDKAVLTFLLTGYSNMSIWTLVWISNIFKL